MVNVLLWGTERHECLIQRPTAGACPQRESSSMKDELLFFLRMLWILGVNITWSVAVSLHHFFGKVCAKCIKVKLAWLVTS